jgi:hypothetical protein
MISAGVVIILGVDGPPKTDIIQIAVVMWGNAGPEQASRFKFLRELMSAPLTEWLASGNITSLSPVFRLRR